MGAITGLFARDRRWATLALLAVLGLGLALRLPGLAHDLPALYTHDEVSTVDTALRVGSGTLRPYSFGHGTLMPYVLAGVYAAYFVALRAVGTVAGAGDLLVRYLVDPTPFYLAYRALTVAFSLGLVAAVYIAGRRLFTVRAAVLAAALTAVAPLLVVLAVVGREDMLYLFLVGGVLALAARLHRGHATAWTWLAAGACVGLATATKYFGIFAVLLPLLAFRGTRADFGRGILWMGAGLVGGAFVGMPFAFLDPSAFVADLAKLRAQTGMAVATSALDGLAYPTIHLANAVGWPVQLAFAVCAVALGVRHPRLALLLVAPPVLFLGGLALRPGNQGPYYVAFAVPFVALVVGWGIDAAASRIPRAALGAAAAALAIAGLAWTSVDADIRYLRYLAMPDTRDAARVWIEANVPRGASILVETNATDFGVRDGPPLRESVATLRRERELIVQAGGSGRLWDQKLALAAVDDSRPRFDLVKTHTMKPRAVAAGPDFVIASARPAPVPETYAALARDYQLTAVFVSSANFPGAPLATIEELRGMGQGRRGPTITVWRRRS